MNIDRKIIEALLKDHFQDLAYGFYFGNFWVRSVCSFQISFDSNIVTIGIPRSNIFFRFRVRSLEELELLFVSQLDLFLETLKSHYKSFSILDHLYPEFVIVDSRLSSQMVTYKLGPEKYVTGLKVNVGPYSMTVDDSDDLLIFNNPLNAVTSKELDHILNLGKIINTAIDT